MDQRGMLEMMYRQQHRHLDGTWVGMEPDPRHDPAEHDDERPAGRLGVFRCTLCDEVVTVVRGEEPAPGARH